MSTKTSAETSYTKQQILSAKKYRNNIDLVDALLTDGKQYTISQVDELINKYLKGKVK